MRKLSYFLGTVLCSLAAGNGCALKSVEGWENGTLTNGERALVSIEGGGENGRLINGKSVAGSEVQGRNVAGISADGSALNGIILKDSGLETMRVSDGAVLSGAALVGATFATQMPDSSPIELRIDAHSASPSEHHARSTVHRYALSYRQSGMSLWAPVCGELNYEPVLAIPLAGRWSYEQGVPGGGSWLDEPDWITFACSGYALYKCVGLGYEPWTSARGEQLDRHHQACVRAFRADYCGDGRSYTMDGHLINIFDNLEIQRDTERWSLESEWDENGARCLSHLRIQDGIEPDCAAEIPGCDNRPDRGGTLVVTEVP